MVYVFARAGSNVTLNCSDLGEDMVTWRKDEGEKIIEMKSYLFIYLLIG